MSSRRSRNGGTVMTNAPRRKYRSSRNVPASTAARRSRLVAATTRALTLMLRSRADAPDLALLQGPQQLRLHGGRDFADLVEEDRAVAGDFEQARLVANRTGEGASHVAEQLGFEQRLGQRRAVDAHERRRGARALIVDQPDDELLAGAALAVDEHGRIERRDARRQLQDVLHRLAAGDEVLRRRMAIDALAQQVQLTLAPLQQPLAAIQFLQARADGLAQALDFVAEIGRLEVGADRLRCRPPSSPRRARSPRSACAPWPRTPSRGSRFPSPDTR